MARFISTTERRAGNVGDTIPHVQYPTAGGSAAWNADGDGVYYTRFPRKGERPDADVNFYQQVYFHKLGTPESEDTYSIGKDFPRIAEIQLESSQDGKYVVASVANGDGGDYRALPVRPGRISGQQITQYSDEVKLARIGRDDALYLLSRKDAPRGKVLRLPLETPDLAKAKEIVPASEAVIQRLEPTDEGALCRRLAGRALAAAAFRSRREERADDSVAEDFESSWSWFRLVDGSLIFRAQSYTEPSTWFEIAPGRSEPTKTALVQHFAGLLCRHRSDARVRALEGWHEGAAQYHPAERDQARREQPDAALRLRRLWHQHVAHVRFHAPALVRPRRRLCRGQHPRRRGVRRGMAQGREPDEETKCLRRLRGRGAVPDRAEIHPPGEAGARWAEATAACSWARSSRSTRI